MRKPSVVMRVLCGAVDFLIIMIPIQFIMMGIFRVSTSQADFFFKLLFAIYAAMMTEYCGVTLGKYFGRLRVVDISGGKPVLLYLGLRELAKSLYLIPFLGWGIGCVSLVMMAVRKDGRALHDLIGNTRIVYSWQLAELEEKNGLDE